MDAIVQIKNSLIAKIQNSKDLNLLKAIQLILERSEPEYFQLSEEQNQKITQARNEIEKGNFISNSQAISELKQWLENK